jgi:hypothetical protein
MMNVFIDGVEYAPVRKPLAYVEGKPVFVGDELYWDDGRNITANELWGNHSDFHRMTWHPTKPKTVMVDLLREDAETLLAWYEFTCDKTRENVATACRKALEEK